ncbi:MAG: extracellular solute-binding protein [Pseudomonadota bacterium]
MQVTRRTVINSLSGALASSLVSRAVRADGPFPFETMHEGIVERVKRLAGRREDTLAVLYPKGSRPSVNAVARRFQAVTGVTVALQEAPLDDINSSILLSKLTGLSDFDVALPATFGIPDLAEAGALYDLDGFAAQYEPADFQKRSLYSIGDYYKGRLYGYQTDGDVYLMFYNQAFLDNPEAAKRFADQYGRPLALPSSWAELDEMIGFFHRPYASRYGGALFRRPDYLPWEWWTRFHAKGVLPFDDGMEPQIAGEAGVEALADLIAVTANLHPGVRTDGLFENWKRFAAGETFCNIGWGGSQKAFNAPDSAVRGRLSFDATPAGLIGGQKVPTPYFNWGWNYVVSAQTPRPELAYLFCLFACSPIISTEAVGEAEGYFDPFRLDHYDDPKIEKIYSRPFLDSHRAGMAAAIPDLYLNGQADYFGALRENMAAALAGDLTPQEAMDRAARRWRITTYRLGKENQLQQWQFLKSRYPAPWRDL